MHSFESASSHGDGGRSLASYDCVYGDGGRSLASYDCDGQHCCGTHCTSTLIYASKYFCVCSSGREGENRERGVWGGVRV